METLQLIVISLSAILFSIGGLCWKPARRFILPIILSGIALYCGLIWWKAVGLLICLAISLSMPYGDKTSYPLKALTFIAMFASTLWLGFSWWIVISPVIVFVMFVLSNWKVTQNIVFWRVWEFMTGAYLGITVSDLITRL